MWFLALYSLPKEMSHIYLNPYKRLDLFKLNVLSLREGWAEGESEK